MKYQKTILANGSPLFLLQMPSSSNVTISAYIKAGYRFDPVGKPGLAHFVEHMLFSGTKKYPSHRDLALAIEKYGGYHMAFTWIDYQNHYIHFPREQFHLGAEILLDTLFQSLIAKEEVEKEKGIVKREVLRNLSDTEKAVWSYVWLPHFFQGTVLSRPYSGTEKDIENFTRNDVIQFIHSRFHPSNIAYFIAGDVEMKEAEEIINRQMEKYLLEFKKIPPPVIKRETIKHESVRKYPSDYVSLIVAIPTVSIYSFDRHILEILRNILSRDFGASIPEKLRNHGGLVYTFSSYQDNLFDTGYLLFQTATWKKNVTKVIQIILEEFQRISQGKIDDKEIDIAKDNLIGRLLSNIETGSDYIDWYALQELYALNPVLHIQDQIRIYRSISKKDILAVARKYFTHDQIYIAAYGNIRQQEIKKLLL